jgi:hypothetical protein
MKGWNFRSAFRRPKDKGKFEKAERCSERCLLDIRVSRNFVVSSYKVKFGKGGAAGRSSLVYVDLGTCLEFCEGRVLSSRHRASNRCPWAQDGGRTTTVLRRVGQYRPATWRRTRPWRRPSGLERVGAGGRLPAGRVLSGCGVLCCVATHDGWSAPGIPPGGCLEVYPAMTFTLNTWWRDEA